MKSYQLCTAALVAVAGSMIGLADTPGCPPTPYNPCLYASSSATALAGPSTQVFINDSNVTLKSWSAQRQVSRVRYESYVSNPAPPGSGCDGGSPISTLLSQPIGATSYDDNSTTPSEDSPIEGFYSADVVQSQGPESDSFPMLVGIDSNGISVRQSVASLGWDYRSGWSLPGCNLSTSKSLVGTSSSQSAYLRGRYSIDPRGEIEHLGHIRINLGIASYASWSWNPAYAYIPPQPPEYAGCYAGCLQVITNPIGTWYTGSSCVRLTFINDQGVAFFSGVVSANWTGIISFPFLLDGVGSAGVPYLVGVETTYHNDFSSFALNEPSYGDINEPSLTLSGELIGEGRDQSCGPGCSGAGGSASIPKYLTSSTDPANTPSQQLDRDRHIVNTVNIDLKKMARQLPGFTSKFSVQASVVQQTVPFFAGGSDEMPDMTYPHYTGLAPAISFAGGGGCTSAFLQGRYTTVGQDPRFRPPPPPFDPRLPCNADIAGPGQSGRPDGEYTPDDIIKFLNRFFAGDYRADISGPGQNRIPDGQFTADDIIVYFNCFFGGRPPYPPDEE